MLCKSDLWQVREYHRRYFEEGKGTRDVLIIAHGHFNRVFISRWLSFELALGMIQLGDSMIPDVQARLPGTHFNVEPGGVSVFLIYVKEN